MTDPAPLNPQQQVAQAEDAQRVLDSPAFQQACAQLERSIIEAIIACPPRDTEALVLLKQQIQLARSVGENLRALVNLGSSARLTIVQAHENRAKPLDGRIIARSR